MKNRSRIVLWAAIVGGMGVLAGPALGDGVRVYSSRGLVSVGGHGACVSFACGVAGTLSIDGCRTTIRSGFGVDEEIVRAFRRAGYDASCSQGRVVVRFGCRRPSLGWLDRDYSARFAWQRDCLIITTFQKRCDACDACRGPGHHGVRRNPPRPICPPPRIHHPRHRDTGWSFRWSSRRVCG